MNSQDWYSANVRLVSLHRLGGASLYMDCIFLFRAGTWEQAFLRGLELGRAQEQQYTNAGGDDVRWRVVKILHLNWVKANSLDGAEIHSDFVDLPEGVSFPYDAEFRPEDHQPDQTI